MKDGIGKGKEYEDKCEDPLRQTRQKERGLFSLKANCENKTGPYKICCFA